MRRLHSIKQERPNISETHKLMMHGLFNDLKLSKFKIENEHLYVWENHGGGRWTWTFLGEQSAINMWVRYGKMYSEQNNVPIDVSKFNIEVV